MPNPIPISIYDERQGDTYVCHLDEEGEFDYALRYVVGFGHDPIAYHHLVDVPEPQRSELEYKIHQRKR